MENANLWNMTKGILTILLGAWNAAFTATIHRQIFLPKRYRPGINIAMSAIAASLKITVAYGAGLPLDSATISHWATVGTPALSADGRYAALADHSERGNSVVIVRTTGASWRVEENGVLLGFSADSRLAILSGGENAGITILTLGSSSRMAIPNARSAVLRSRLNNSMLMFRRPRQGGQDVVLRKLSTGKESVFQDIAAFELSDDGSSALLRRSTGSAPNQRIQLIWLEVQTERIHVLWEGSSVDRVHFDAPHVHLAFIGEKAIDGAETESLWYFQRGDLTARRIADVALLPLSRSMRFGDIEAVAGDGGHVFLGLKKVEPKGSSAQSSKLHIWNYRDSSLESMRSENRSYLASIRVSDGRLTVLEGEGDQATLNGSQSILIQHRIGDSGERKWNPAGVNSIFILSNPEAERIPVGENGQELPNLSAAGHYVIFYSVMEHNWMSYDVTSGSTRNITASIPTSWTSEDNGTPSSPTFPYRPVVWTAADQRVLLYDQYDIWVVDPSGRAPSVSLTKGFGRQHHIVLRLADDSTSLFNRRVPLMLKAFNRDTKETGYFTTMLGTSADPKRLTMGPYVYDFDDIGGQAPIKAAHAEAYLVSRESATASRNWFFTYDFKTFTPISDVHPERGVNWLRSELMNWPLPDGTMDQGVLYKPENFDPSRKYPVIFNYYERLSDKLNAFIVPKISDGELDIPTFVSHGYLVFTPDIHFEVGHPMASALSALESAARYLSTMPWVDASKLGLQGISFGGMETNYIVTHSHLFAAANASSGIDNFVSGYDSILEDGTSAQSLYENTQIRIGPTLWERPDLYIENSAIFNADHTTTPLLLMHTTNDGVCLFYQAEELFVALRRLGKPVWMLQYDDADHFLIGTAAEDFSTRQMQFFDHYLKGSPPPKWMTEDVPTRLKGIETGLELDTSGQEP